ncbi:hypothetical protein ACO22_02091 [Paracoccidioides brasiliensis]|uniref:Endonuclease n=1 Tax=Paracoccidioides brasiliensis TaxID=121759 RepID=A0A1D2JJY8_PARBR|nr:hypothetical protein ACO22_02091 [Paracoccidioides brasiliensis]
MSKATFALIAAAGAATGASVTALIYSSRTRQQQLGTPPPSTRLPPQTTSQPTSLLIPPHPKITTPDTASPVDPVGLFQYGFPGPVCDPVITLPLASAFDRRTRNPSWVAEHLTPESLAQNNADRKKSNFYEEQTIPQAFRARLSDYFRSGYDRGHQVGEGFNRDYWAHFEDFCRRLTKVYPSVRIVTGPLYLPKRDPVDGKWRVTYEVIGNPPNVAVPTHFYKVIFAEDGVTGGKVSLGAFVLPNAHIPNEKSLADFEVPLEAVERASGLEFASKLPAERRKKLCQEVKCEIIARQFVQSSNDIKALRSS